MITNFRTNLPCQYYFVVVQDTLCISGMLCFGLCAFVVLYCKLIRLLFIWPWQMLATAFLRLSNWTVYVCCHWHRHTGALGQVSPILYVFFSDKPCYKLRICDRLSQGYRICSDNLFFQLTLKLHKVRQRLCAVASPNIFVFRNSSCDSSVAATRTLFSMVALWNRADHNIYFHAVVCSSFFPRLISSAADWMSAILPHMVWPQCEFKMQV